MTPTIDPNELFAWLRVCPDAGYLRDLQKQVGERLQALGTSRMAPEVRAQPLTHYVQMTDETRPGGVQTQPMTGPSPAPNLGVDLAALAQANRRREEAQQDELRGPGPVIERVDVGEVAEGEAEEGDKIQQEAEKQAADKVREGLAEAAPASDEVQAARGRQGEQAGPAGQEGHGTPQGPQKPPREKPPAPKQPPTPSEKPAPARQGALPARERQKV